MPMNIEIIDTHCHMDLVQFRPDLDDVLNRSMCAGVTDFVIPGYVRAGWARILKICIEKPYLHPCLGLHPAYCDLHRDEDVEELKELSKREQLVAIGEIGLDFQRGHETERIQQNLFDRVGQVGYKSHGDDLFLKNGIRHWQVSQETINSGLEFGQKNILKTVANIGQFIFEDLHQTEDYILAVHQDVLINYISLFCFPTIIYLPLWC